MNTEQITPTLVENALKAWQKGDTPPSEFLDLELVKQFEGSDEARLNALRDKIYQQIFQELKTCRIRLGLSPGETISNSPKDVATQIASDFSKQNALLEGWSALYYQYVEGALEVQTLVKIALPGPDQIFKTNQRQFRRQLQKALKRLRKTICEWETDAQTDHRRVQLPGREYADYYDPMGRVQRISEMLTQPDGVFLLSIEGLGGIGKTALARQVAENIANHSKFTRVIWISARQQRFNARARDSVEQQEHAAHSRSDVFSALVNKLGYDHLNQYSIEEKVERLIPILSNLAVLIVIDNLETLDDSLLLVPDLQRFQGTARFLLTSRDSLAGFDGVSIYPVAELPFADCQRLLREELHRLGSKQNLLDSEVRQVYTVVGGVPLALKLIAAQLTVIPDIDRVLADVRTADHNKKPELMFEFIYRRTWGLLNLAARQLLLAIYDSVSPEGAELDWIESVAADGNLSGAVFLSALQELITYSLIEVIPERTSPHYSLHRLTITFLQTNIAQTHWTDHLNNVQQNGV